MEITEPNEGQAKDAVASELRDWLGDITMYRVDLYGYTVQEIKVLRKTDKTVWLKNKLVERRARRNDGGWEAFFDTKKEAQEYLINNVGNRIDENYDSFLYRAEQFEDEMQKQIKELKDSYDDLKNEYMTMMVQFKELVCKLP